MLKKKNRLLKKEFDFVFKNGQKKFSKNFLFIFLEAEKSPKGDFSASKKISSTISKKIYKKAVDRNFCRRIIYKILQKNFQKIFLEKEKNFWAILIATKPILEIEKKDLEKEILNFFK